MPSKSIIPSIPYRYNPPSYNFFMGRPVAPAVYGLSRIEGQQGWPERQREQTWQFWCNVFEDTYYDYIRKGEARWIAKPSAFIKGSKKRKGFFPHSRWSVLVDAGILEVMRHDWGRKKCRLFRIPLHIMRFALDLHDLSGCKHEINIYSRDHHGSKKPRNKLGKKPSSLHRQAVTILNKATVKWSPSKADKHIAEVERLCRKHRKHKKKLKSCQAKLTQMLGTLQSIRGRSDMGTGVGTEPAIYSDATFSIQFGGRLTEHGIGLQGLHRLCRLATLSGQGYSDADINDCHPNGLYHGTGHEPLRLHLQQDRAATAAKLGISAKRYKQARLSMVYCAGPVQTRPVKSAASEWVRGFWYRMARVRVTVAVRRAGKSFTATLAPMFRKIGHKAYSNLNETECSSRSETFKICSDVINTGFAIDSHSTGLQPLQFSMVGTGSESNPMVPDSTKHRGRGHNAYSNLIKAWIRCGLWSIKIRSDVTNTGVSPKQKLPEPPTKRDMNKRLRGKWVCSFTKEVQPILDAVEVLCAKEIANAKTYGRFGENRKFIENAVGKRYYFEGRPELEQKKKIPVLIIHGLEVLFILTLIIEATKAGTKVVSYQYDGCITAGGIPDYVLDAVRAKTGLPFKVKQVALK